MLNILSIFLSCLSLILGQSLFQRWLFLLYQFYHRSGQDILNPLCESFFQNHPLLYLLLWEMSLCVTLFPCNCLKSTPLKNSDMNIKHVFFKGRENLIQIIVRNISETILESMKKAFLPPTWFLDFELIFSSTLIFTDNVFSHWMALKN